MLITILVRTLRFVLPLKLVINLSTFYEKGGYDLWSCEGSDQGDGNPSTCASSTTSVLYVEDRTSVSKDRPYLIEDRAIAACFRWFEKSEFAVARSLSLIC